MTVPVARRRGNRTMRWPAVDPAAASDTQAAPWNSGTYLTTPTYDGSNVATHPSVLDFGDLPWNGWRYWMALTPYRDSDPRWENPSILVSADGITWQVPDGLTNPIHPWPGTNGYNADPDLVYDPLGGRLICYFLTVDPDGVARRTLAKWSTDGVTWSEATDLRGAQVSGEYLSPAVVRRAAGDWWMFAINRVGPAQISVTRTTDPLAGWDAEPYIGPLASLGAAPWHMDVVWDRTAFRMLIVGAGTPYDMWALSSVDGHTWAASAVVMTSRAEEWDAKLYRPTIVVRDDTWMRVWYSATSGPYNMLWHVGATQMPRSLWPDPPAPQ